MTHYLISFSIYTTAMIGIIFLALFIFKTFSNKCFTKKSSTLNIEDSMNLSPRKTLYIVRADNERFLIASDVDKTNLIAKLDSDGKVELKPVREDKSFKLSSFDGVDSLNEFASIVELQREKPNRDNVTSLNKGPMMKELVKRLSAI